MKFVRRWRIPLRLGELVLVVTVMATVVVMTGTSQSGAVSRKTIDLYSARTLQVNGTGKNESQYSTGGAHFYAVFMNSSVSPHAHQKKISSNLESKIPGTNPLFLQDMSLDNLLQGKRKKRSSNSEKFHYRIRRFEDNISRSDPSHDEERQSRNANSSSFRNSYLIEYRTGFLQSNQNSNSTKTTLGDSEKSAKGEQNDEKHDAVADGMINVSILSEQLVVPLVNLSQLVLKKCNCPKNHVSVLNENGHLCFASDAAVIDVLVRPIYNEIISVGESSFAHVKIENLTCSFPQEIVHMTEREFLLLLSGEIRHEVYNTLISQDQYCVEFIQYPNGVKEWVAMACVEPPYIKKCCHAGYTFDPKQLKCVEDLKEWKLSSSLDEINEEISFQPPYEMDEALLHFGVDLSSKHGLPTCLEGETVFAVKLGKYAGNLVQLEHFLHEVQLFVSHDDFSVQKYYKNSEFCIDGPTSLGIQNETDYTAVFCYDDPHSLHHNICTKKNKHCIRKCCPHNQIIDMVSIGCREPLSYNYIYKPLFHKSSWYDNMVPVSKDIPYEVVFGEPLCHPVDVAEENFYLLDDGTVYLSKEKLRFSSEDYCVDARQGYFNQTDVVVHYCPFQGQPFGDSCWRLRVYLYPMTLMVSCLFLLFTLILYKVVPELRMNISGKSLVSHVFSLLLAFLCLLIIYVGRLSERNLVLCQVMAFVTQYSYLATFCWLSAMCFEMWYRIRFLPTRAVSPSEARYKYKMYSAYGWGVPAVITAVTGVVHGTVPVSDQSSLTPNFGNPYCWFRDEPATWLYFSGIVTLLCVANIFFFLDLANISLKQCLGSTLIHVSRQQHMERILLCLKLFIVMGVTWIFEEISYQDGACARWIPTDLINILRGPCVFLSVVSTRSVINKLKAKQEAFQSWLSDRGAPFLSGSPSKGPSTASSSKRVPNMGLVRARGFPQARQPTDSGSHNSLASLKTQETSIDPKSDSSSSAHPQEISEVYHRENSVLTQDSECSSATENNEVISQSPSVMMPSEKDPETWSDVCPARKCLSADGAKTRPKTDDKRDSGVSCGDESTGGEEEEDAVANTEGKGIYSAHESEKLEVKESDENQAENEHQAGNVKDRDFATRKLSDEVSVEIEQENANVGEKNGPELGNPSEIDDEKVE